MTCNYKGLQNFYTPHSQSFKCIHAVELFLFVRGCSLFLTPQSYHIFSSPMKITIKWQHIFSNIRCLNSSIFDALFWYRLLMNNNYFDWYNKVYCHESFVYHTSNTPAFSKENHQQKQIRCHMFPRKPNA